MKNTFNLINFFVLSAIFMSCASIQPMTDTILDAFGGERNIENFQYYVSTTLILHREDTSSQSAIVGGQAKLATKTIRETITIASSTPGIVLEHFFSSDKTWILKVAFEDDDDSLLWFGKRPNSEQEEYYLKWDDFQKRIIEYGGVNYVAQFAGDESPYLLIKMTSKQKKEESKRKAKGRTLPKK